MKNHAPDRDSSYRTTRILSDTLDDIDRIKSNLLRVGTGVLPQSLQKAIGDRQIDKWRLNRSAIIAIGNLLIEEKLCAAGCPTPPAPEKEAEDKDDDE
jgi:hypothetical protein